MLNGRLRMRGYIKPKMKVIRLSGMKLMAGSDTVEFRFDTRINGEWDGKDEIVLE